MVRNRAVLYVFVRARGTHGRASYAGRARACGASISSSVQRVHERTTWEEDRRYDASIRPAAAMRSNTRSATAVWSLFCPRTTCAGAELPIAIGTAGCQDTGAARGETGQTARRPGDSGRVAHGWSDGCRDAVRCRGVGWDRRAQVSSAAR